MTEQVQQVGGDHYQSEFQHWDWVTAVGMGYLAGNATKYVSRWRKKNGLQDLLKGMSYVDKLLTTGDMFPSRVAMSIQSVIRLNEKFYDSAGLDPLERLFCSLLATAYGRDQILEAKLVLQTLVDQKTLPDDVGQATGQATGQQATTLAAQGATPALPSATGQAQGITGQASTTSRPTGAQISRSRGLVGLEHPFGYDEDDGA